MAFYSIGRWIVEEQQQGESRAKYGQRVIKKLSEALTEQYERGFSVDTLENARRFFLTYQDRISETVFRKFAVEKCETVFSLFKKETPFILPWSHYLQLMHIKDEKKKMMPLQKSHYQMTPIFMRWNIIKTNIGEAYSQ